MTTNTRPSDPRDLWRFLSKRLAAARYRRSYATESDFEADVWKCVCDIASQLGLDPARTCLTSHKERPGRSPEAWQKFCGEPDGPDVEVLGTANRLDIVFQHPTLGSIGIEVKCLGRRGHPGKFTQGLGQAVLGLAKRDRTMLVIHCGTVSARHREQLREVSRKITSGTATGIIVVP